MSLFVPGSVLSECCVEYVHVAFAYHAVHCRCIAFHKEHFDGCMLYSSAMVVSSELSDVMNRLQPAVTVLLSVSLLRNDASALPATS